MLPCSRLLVITLLWPFDVAIFSCASLELYLGCTASIVENHNFMEHFLFSLLENHFLLCDHSMWTTEHFFQLVTITFSVDCPVPGTARLAAVEFSCPCHKNFHAHAQFLFKNFYAHWHCPELDSVSFDFLNLIFSMKCDHHYHHVKLLIGPMVLGRWIAKKNLSS